MRERFARLILLGVLLGACAGIPSDLTRPDGTGGADTTAAADITAPTPTTARPATTAPPETTEGPPATTVPPPETTAPPDTIEAPATTAAAAGEGEEEDDGLDPAVIWAVIGLVLALVLLGWLMGQARRPTPPVLATATPTWKDHLRDGYSEARWLNDSMTEDLAMWRGNSLAKDQPESAGTAMADRWSQLDPRMNQARDHLYRAEASAPDQPTALLMRNVVNGLTALRAAIDARAEARWEASAMAADPGAAERERVASSNLTEARAALDGALQSVAGLH